MSKQVRLYHIDPKIRAIEIKLENKLMKLSNIPMYKRNGKTATKLMQDIHKGLEKLNKKRIATITHTKMSNTMKIYT